jgi:hypothetical protein
VEIWVKHCGTAGALALRFICYVGTNMRLKKLIVVYSSVVILSPSSSLYLRSDEKYRLFW